ncbi:PcfB family protein, partial [Dysosmobacter welbionis]
PAVPAVQHRRGDVAPAAAAADAGHCSGASRHRAVCGLCRRRRRLGIRQLAGGLSAADTSRSGGGKEVRRMESFRLKNIIILILALMNLCLLGLLGVRLTTGYSAQ